MPFILKSANMLAFCPYCNKSYKNSQSLGRHIRKKHPGLESKLRNKSKVVKKFKNSTELSEIEDKKVLTTPNNMSNIMTSPGGTSSPKVSKLMSKTSQDPSPGQHSLPFSTSTAKKGTTRPRSKSVDAANPPKKLKQDMDASDDGEVTDTEMDTNSGGLNADSATGPAQSDNNAISTSNAEAPSFPHTVSDPVSSAAAEKTKSNNVSKSTRESEQVAAGSPTVESSSSAAASTSSHYFQEQTIKKLWGLDDNDCLSKSIFKFLNNNEVLDIDQIATIENANSDSVSFFAALMFVKTTLSSTIAQLASISIPPTIKDNNNYIKDTLKWSTVLAASKSSPNDMINGNFFSLPSDVYNEIPMTVQNYIGSVHKDISYLINFQRITSMNLADHLASILTGKPNVLTVKFALYDWIFGLLYGNPQSATHSLLKMNVTENKDIVIKYKNDDETTALVTYKISSYVLEHNNIALDSPWDLQQFDFTTVNSLVKFINFCGTPTLDFEVSVELANALDKMKLVRLLGLEDKNKDLWKFSSSEDKLAILLEHSNPEADLGTIIDSVSRLPYNSRLEIILKLQEKGLKRLYASENFENDEYERYIYLLKWSYYKNNEPVPILFTPNVRDEVKKTFASVVCLLKPDKLRKDLPKISRQGLISVEKQKEIAGLKQPTTPTSAPATIPTAATSSQTQQRPSSI